MYLLLLFKLEGLLTFYFYRAQKKGEREPFAHRVPKKTPAPPSEGPCLGGWRGPPGCSTPQRGPSPPLLPHTPTPGLHARLLMNWAGSIQAERVRGAGQDSPLAGPELRLRQREEQDGVFPETGHQPRNILNIAPGEAVSAQPGTREAQHRAEMSTKASRPSQDTSAPSPAFRESPSEGRGDSRTPVSNARLHLPSAVRPGGGPGQCRVPI